MGTKPQPFVTRRTPAGFSFAGYTLDLTAGTLRRGTDQLKLRPKSYATLKHLVENAGRLVLKTELMAVLWPDATAVSDDSLTHCIMDVRRVLGDDGQQFIRTVPGRGYLFAAPVQVEQERARSASVTKPSHSAWRIPKRAVIATGLTLIAVAGLAWAVKNRADQSWAHKSVPRIEELAAGGKYAEAYELALKVLAVLPAESRAIGLMSELSDDLSVST